MSPEDNFYRDSLVRMRKVLIRDLDQMSRMSKTETFAPSEAFCSRKDALEYVVAMMDDTLGSPTESDEERNARRSTPEGQKN